VKRDVQKNSNNLVDSFVVPVRMCQKRHTCMKRDMHKKPMNVKRDLPKRHSLSRCIRRECVYVYMCEKRHTKETCMLEKDTQMRPTESLDMYTYLKRDIKKRPVCVEKDVQLRPTNSL